MAITFHDSGRSHFNLHLHGGLTMSYADVDICNIALARIGVTQTIGNLSTEQSKEARNCRLFYPLARDEVLERVPWPFAVRVKALAQLTEAEIMPGFSYGYAQPADAASIIEVIPAGDVAVAAGYYCNCQGPWSPPRKGAYAFRRAMSDDGTTPVILSNLDDAYAVYVSKVTNTAAFSTMMVSLIADRLAMELAMPMTTDPRWFGVCQQRYTLQFMDTSSRDFEQEVYGPDNEPASIRARN
jgi:hypothetical protein